MQSVTSQEITLLHVTNPTVTTRRLQSSAVDAFVVNYTVVVNFADAGFPSSAVAFASLSDQLTSFVDTNHFTETLRSEATAAGATSLVHASSNTVTTSFNGPSLAPTRSPTAAPHIEFIDDDNGVHVNVGGIAGGVVAAIVVVSILACIFARWRSSAAMASSSPPAADVSVNPISVYNAPQQAPGPYWTPQAGAPYPPQAGAPYPAGVVVASAAPIAPYPGAVPANVHNKY